MGMFRDKKWRLKAPFQILLLTTQIRSCIVHGRLERHRMRYRRLAFR